MKSRQEDQILDFIRRNAHRPMKTRELSRAIGIPSGRYAEFRREIKRLIDEGKLVRLKRNRIGLPDQMDLATGEITIKRSGFGFVKCDNSDEEIFVAARDLHTAMEGDRVMARIKRDGKGFRGKREGVVLRILDRKTTRLVGVYRKSDSINYVEPEGKGLYRDIIVPKGGTGRARDGEKVVIELLPWDDPYRSPEGKVVERLGQIGDPGVDMLSVIRRYQLATDFPKDVMQEAEQASFEYRQELKKRRDLTGLTLLTIDPIDARDHDDAVSIEMNDGTYRLGVHIADVSYFVREGSALDREAAERATSIYLPDRVLPMLPEELSADLCSLRPNEKRLAYSIFMDIDQSGEVRSYELCQSVIESRARLSYEQVQSFFDGKAPSRGVKKVTQELSLMRLLARILYNRREAAGSLDFDLPEAKITLDEKGNVVNIGNRVRTESHRLIEEFMLAANRQVALHFFRNGQPTLYRVHGRPDQEKLEAFAHLVSGFGYNFSVSPAMPSRDFGRFLEKVRGKPEEELIFELLLRSMQKAIYQPENIGHFGLAFTHYLHFTSPIRRYPDLLVHRLLKRMKNNRYPARFAQKLPSLLKRVGRHSSERERLAMEVEREAVKIKQVEYMAQHVGDEYEGIISGVTNYGFFVRLNEPGAEGMVRVSSLDDDYYQFDEAGHRLRGRRFGRTYRLGDRLRVGVARVNLEEKEIDLFIANPPPPPKKSKRGKNMKSKKRR